MRPVRTFSRKSRRGVCALYMFVAPLLLGGEPVYGQSSHQPHIFLRKVAGLSRDDLTRMERGEVIVEALDTGHSNEITMLGVATLGIPSDFFVSRFQDIERFKRGKDVLAIGKFGDPPRPSDLQGLSLEPEDIEAVRECEVGDCGVKLSAEMIGRFRAEVDWTSTDHAEQADALFRGMLMEYVQRYLLEGDAALLEYHDKKKPVRISVHLREMLGEPPHLLGFTGDIRRHLEEFPRYRLPGAIDFLYWSKDRYGPLKPVISVAHVTIYEPSGRGDLVLIASKQIYASHYFNAMLSMTSLIGETGGLGEPARYLLYLNRSRVDALGGWLGLKRGIVERKASGAMERHVERIRSRLLDDWRKEGGIAARRGPAILPAVGSGRR